MTNSIIGAAARHRNPRLSRFSIDAMPLPVRLPPEIPGCDLGGTPLCRAACRRLRRRD